MLLLFGWTQTNFAVEPTEQEILQILENLKLKQFWFSISAKKAISGFCQNSNVPRVIDASSAPKADLQRWHFIAFLKFIKRTGYWTYQGEFGSDEINLTLYENQLILIDAFCQTLGLAILESLKNKDAVDAFFEFMTGEIDKPILTDFFIENLIIIKAQIFLFLTKKIDLLIDIIKMLIPDEIEARQKIVAFYQTIIKIGTDSEEGEQSFSARIANARFKISPPIEPDPIQEHKRGIKRKRSQIS